MSRLTTYAATKAFAVSFTDALHTELRGSGVRILAVGDAIWSWPDLLWPGLRVGAPAVSDGSAVRADPSQSSIFSFAKDNDDALSSSIVMSMAEAQARVTDPKALRTRLDTMLAVSEKVVRIERIEDVLVGILDALMTVFPQAERAFLMVGTSADDLTPRAVRERRPGTQTPSVSRSLCGHALSKRGGVL